jgi:hypothetical protein
MKYEPGDLSIRKSTAGTTEADHPVAGPSRPQRTRWELYAVLGLVIVSLIGYGIWTLVQNGLDEVTDMGPWPATDVSASEAVDLHLDHLGFTDNGVYRIRDDYMPGPYIDDAGITFFSEDEPVVTIWIVKYSNFDAAASALDLLGSTSACSKLVTVSIGSRGKIRCSMSDAHESVYRNDGWLVDIIAFDTSSRRPSELADLVRDLLSEHWQKIRSSSELHARSNPPETNSPAALFSG